MASGGRAFTTSPDKLPGGRGHGEPIRLSLELAEEETVVDMFVPEEGGKRLLASTAGNGFICPDAEMISSTRKGKTIMKPGEGELMACVRADGDLVAVIGENRKLLIFKTNEIPEMTGGKGVRLQAYADGGLLDAKTFNRADGFGWTDAAGRQQSADDWKDWIGKRAQSGRMAPRGFNKNGRFSA
jgi:topoisomerase-4 subunit A